MKVLNVLESIDFSSEKMKKVSLFDTDNFFCDIYCLEPEQFQKVHSHEGSDKVYMVEASASRAKARRVRRSQGAVRTVRSRTPRIR